jgi:hypothetical protein
MPKLSKEQFRLLLWLSLPSSFFEVTSAHHLNDVLYNGLHGYKDEKGKKYKFDIRTLQALAANKLVDFETVYYCGLEWTRYTITDAGKLLALNVVADCNV